MTEWHVRYGGKGIMIYWHVEKHAACIYSQLKNLFLVRSCGHDRRFATP
jgi:TnpA family transposase